MNTPETAQPTQPTQPPEPAQPAGLFIALYYKYKSCAADHHWALVVSAGDPGTAPVSIYELEIAEADDAAETRAYVLNHHIASLEANDNVQFLGAIRMPQMTDMEVGDVPEYLAPFTTTAGPPAAFNTHVRP